MSIERTEIQPGTSINCDESRANPDAVPDPHTEAMWADYPRFSAVVDHVDGDYVEATVTRSNDHPRAPDHGCSLAKCKQELSESDRWAVS